MNKKTWIIISPFIIGVMVFLDQITKYLANRNLADGEYVIINKVLTLYLTHNKGAAWGILEGKVDILSIISVVLSIFLVYFFFKIPEGKRYHIMRFLTLSVIAGSIGNLIDRCFAGEVTDFIYIELIDFPKFNVADCFITWAMVLLVILMIFYYKEEELDFIGLSKNKKSADDNKVDGDKENGIDKDSIDKDSIDKDSIDKDSIDKDNID